MIRTRRFRAATDPRPASVLEFALGEEGIVASRDGLIGFAVAAALTEETRVMVNGDDIAVMTPAEKGGALEAVARTRSYTRGRRPSGMAAA